jgi:6,7-dimethyl-8-ribityllumazine synthase
MSRHTPSPLEVDGRRFSFGLVAARYNPELVDGLLQRVLDALAAAGVAEKRVTVLRVPGSHEVPVAAGWLADGGFDAVIALGVLIGGDTNHHEMVGQSVSHALQQVSVATGVPVINGVVVTDTWKQAADRCTGRVDRGAEFARAALEMAALRRSVAGGKSK